MKFKFCLLSLFCGSFFAAGTNASKTAELKKKIDSYYKKGEFSGVALVAKGDKIIYKGAVGLANQQWRIPNSVNTKFRLCSITRQFTAMQLVAFRLNNEIFALVSR